MSTNQSSDLTLWHEHVDVAYTVDLAEIPALAAVRRMDADGDGTSSRACRWPSGAWSPTSPWPCWSCGGCGAARPALTVVEYSDYQCPHCRRGHDELRGLVREHPERVRLVHRDYPLDHHCNDLLKRPFHPQACRYAVLAHCAGEQGRFWEANDVLYSLGRRRASSSMTWSPPAVASGGLCPLASGPRGRDG